MSNFDKVMDFILAEEGGYVNNPADPGGETNFGISKRQYPGIDIKNLTKELAKSIYAVDFWRFIQGDELPLPIALMLMDAAVNMGPSAAVHILQDALGVASDGKLGPFTLSRVLAIREINNFIAEYTALRFFEYTEMTNFHAFGLGWSRRVARCMMLAVGFNQTPPTDSSS